MAHCLGCPGPLSRTCLLCTSLVSTLCKFYRCSKGMRSIALCMHCERWIPVPLWRYYKMIGKSGSLQPWLSESIVTQTWVKPQAGAYCWWQKRRLEMSLRFIITRFANLGDLDEIAQWHSTFCTLVIGIRWNLTFRT